MIKKKILAWLILVSVIIVSFNIVTGIIQVNFSSKAYSVLIDNQTGEDITSIGLNVQGNELWRTFTDMQPGNYEEFVFSMDNQEEAFVENSDMTITIHLKDENLSKGFTIQDATVIPIKEGKRTLIKLVGNKSLGFKVEFISLL